MNRLSPITIASLLWWIGIVWISCGDNRKPTETNLPESPLETTPVLPESTSSLSDSVKTISPESPLETTPVLPESTSSLNDSVKITSPEMNPELLPETLEGTSALYDKLALQGDALEQTLIAFTKEDSLYLMTANGKYQAKVGYGSWLSWSPSGTHISFRDQTWEKIGTRHFTVNWRTQSQIEADLSWSPDGQKGVTTIRDGDYSIYVMDADGSTRIRLTDGGSPIWSPDGERILFHRRDNGFDRIFIINTDGTNETEVARGFAYSFSPDGKKVLFNGIADDATSIDIANIDGTDYMRLRVSREIEGTPQWSPDSRKILFNLRGGYYVMDVDGSNEILVGISDQAIPTNYAWSPDGSRIAFTNYTLECNTCDEYRSYIHVVSSLGTEEIQLGSGRFFSWSPDGAKIAAGILEVDLRDGKEKEFIYVMNPDGAEKVRLSEGTRPMWSPFITD